MLVTFTCKAHADITMFGDVAKRLLSIMGHSGTVPGAIRPDDIPEAVDKLKRAIAEDSLAEDSLDQDDKQKVSLAHRAWPLVELLTIAGQENCIVMWDKARG
jgi:hypothetical protein